MSAMAAFVGVPRFTVLCSCARVAVGHQRSTSNDGRRLLSSCRSGTAGERPRSVDWVGHGSEPGMFVGPNEQMGICRTNSTTPIAIARSVGALELANVRAIWCQALKVSICAFHKSWRVLSSITGERIGVSCSIPQIAACFERRRVCPRAILGVAFASTPRARSCWAKASRH